MVELDHATRTALDDTYAALGDLLGNLDSNMEKMLCCSYVLAALDDYRSERSQMERFQDALDAEYQALMG